MLVVNVAGFPFKIEKNGYIGIVPFNGQPFELPDFLGGESFDGMLRILVPPKIQPTLPPEPVKKEPEIIEINLEEEIKVVKKEIKEIETTKPKSLRGVKINSEKRKKLIKKGKPLPQNNKENREKRKKKIKKA